MPFCVKINNQFLSVEGKGVHSECEVSADEGTECTTITVTSESSPKVITMQQYILSWQFHTRRMAAEELIVSYQCTAKRQQKVQSEYPSALDHRAETSSN
jgi:hypothetical protein